MATIRIDGVLNARRIGRRFGLRYIRSANLDRITPEGIADLREHGVTRVIDLRDEGERRTAGSVREAYGDIPVTSIPIYHSPAGAPLTGTLERVYDGILETRGPELAQVVAAITAEPGFTLVHCATGKDRTGIVTALLMLAAGASDEDVVADYVKSAERLGTERHGLVRAMIDTLPITAADRADALRLQLQSPAEAIQHAIGTIDGRGGAQRYLWSAGIGEDTLRTIAERAAAAGRHAA